MAIGVSYETFWHLTPRKLQSFYKAYNLKKKMRDNEMWLMGFYSYNACLIAIQQSFCKNANIDYADTKPLSQLAEENKPLSEEEKQREVDLFFAQEKARRINWKRTHRKESN